MRQLNRSMTLSDDDFVVSIKYCGALRFHEIRLPDDRSPQLDSWSNSWTRDSRDSWLRDWHGVLLRTVSRTRWSAFDWVGPSRRVHERRRQTPEMAEKVRRRNAGGETHFPLRERRDGIFQAESTYAQKSSSIRMYIYYKLTSAVHAVAVEFYLGERSKDASQHPFAGVEAALMHLVLIILLR